MEEFIGFNNIIDGFSKRAVENNLSHAHLIIGPDGIGKSIVAKIFSLKILGKDEDRNYVDIVKYRPKKASFGVDDVRAIIDEVSRKPYEGSKKVIIIHSGDRLTVQAQNALLKTIEEPPRGVFIIILSESLEVLLDTIKSRSQIYKLTPLSKYDMLEYIKKIGEEGNEKVSAALAYAEGIPGRVEKLLRDDSLQILRNLIIDFLEQIGRNRNVVLEYEEKFSKYKTEKEELINLITLFIRDIMVCKELSDGSMIINMDKFNDILELTSLFSYNKLNSMIICINEARNNLSNNIEFSTIISLMLIGFLEE